MDNIIKVQSKIVSDYKDYVESFIHIKNAKIRDVVNKEILGGTLWTEPLIQFNPAYHDKYGEGEILHIAGSGESAKLTVKFGKEMKIFIAGYAKLRGV